MIQAKSYTWLLESNSKRYNDPEARVQVEAVRIS